MKDVLVPNHMHYKGLLDDNNKRKLNLQSLCERFNTLDHTVYIRAKIAYL